jgi:hypothetical protein
MQPRVDIPSRDRRGAVCNEHQQCPSASSKLSLAQAALRSEEENPRREIVRELFEAVDHTRWDKEKVSSSEGHSLFSPQENAAARGHKVDFILFVRLLQVHVLWRVELHGKVSPLEERDEHAAGCFERLCGILQGDLQWFF